MKQGDKDMPLTRSHNCGTDFFITSHILLDNTGRDEDRYCCSLPHTVKRNVIIYTLFCKQDSLSLILVVAVIIQTYRMNETFLFVHIDETGAVATLPPDEM